MMNKKATVQLYEDGIQRLKANGIISYGMFFMGYPGETQQTARNTFEFIQRNAPDFFMTGLWYHDTLAPIHERAEELGIFGAGYNWRHKTMNWREAAEWVHYIYNNIEESTIMPLTGFSFETLPYLLGLGMRLDKIKEFARLAHGMLVATLDDEPQDFSEEEVQLVRICSEIYGDNLAQVAKEALAEAPRVEVAM
jgi:p-methyltransferase